MPLPRVMDDVQILFRDDFLLAVNKPSGLLVHRGWGRDDVVLVDVVKQLLDVEKVHPLHRIDRGTSGVVLFAMDVEIAREMNRRFDESQIDKTYLALVRGKCPKHGTVDHPIPRREDGPRVEAMTDYSLIETAQTQPRHVSLVQANPRTGRLHQVRRHLKHINCPIIGDANYGKGALNREFAKRYGLSRLALHARSIGFEHPVQNKKIEITAPLPDNLTRPLVAMGFDLTPT